MTAAMKQMPAERGFMSSPLQTTPAIVKRKIAIITSGGDAPGMNAAVRSVVRMALVRGCAPYGVIDGYQGLVDGNIKLFAWKDVQGILSQGGTVIGTARCAEFRDRSGRLKAAKNLVTMGIDALVVIGGDGSLTGADTFRSEWKSLLEELVKAGEIKEEDSLRHEHLSIVGLVGSIDNDMAMTDLTIGAVSSLHRICEAVDCISSTAISHQRAFIIEVMGRHCGWLAVMSAIATGSDWLFIPENPPKEGWEDEMCRQLKEHRDMGKRKSIVIVAEGAVDRNLNPIKADYIKELLTNKLKFDTRVTTLGHVQRGGSPSALDRVIGTVQGVEAVEAILQDTPTSETPLIGVAQNRSNIVPLMEAVKKTKEVSEAMKDKNWDLAVELRSPKYRSDIDAFFETSGKRTEQLPLGKRINIAILHCGAPAGGMNMATRALVRMALNRGHKPLLVHNGFKGLVAGDVHEVKWMDVENWSVEGGSRLGTNRSQPGDDLSMCAYQLQKFNIGALVIVGGFEGFNAACELYEARKNFVSFCIPIMLIPATISNNVPGTDFSLGCDTALNVIIEACDCIRQSAHSSRKRVFVVEVQGGECGYLATVAGLASGATCAYIPEEGLTLEMLSRDCKHLIKQYSDGENQGRVILRNESVSKTYTTEVVSNIFAEEGKGLFDSRSSILGHIQQGGSPSPFDRVRAVNFAVRTVKWIEDFALGSIETHEKHLNTGKAEKLEAAIESPCGLSNVDEARVDLVANGIYTNVSESAAVIGLSEGKVHFPSVASLIPETDFKLRKPKYAAFKELNELIRVLAKYGYEEN